MSIDTGKDSIVIVGVALANESMPLLSTDQRSHDGYTREQDEESSISSATAIQEEEEEDTKDGTTPSKVSPTAVVLVLVVGMFFSRVRCQ